MAAITLCGAASAAPSSPGAWVPVPAPPGLPSGDHTATLLPDGRVLVTGGETCGSRCDTSDAGVRAAELYDPATRRWSATSSMAYPREAHTATLLRDGTVLVAGGQTSYEGPTAAAEVWSPRTGQWRTVGPMRHPRLGHTATLLASGRVLVAGGITDPFGWASSTELFDPGSGQWTEGPPMAVRRADHTATLLKDGSILVVGGRDSVGGGVSLPARKPVAVALRSAERYDPATGAWTLVPHLLHTPRTNHTATLLADGTVLLAGGAVAYYHGGYADPTDSVEIYHPDTGRFTGAPALLAPRLAQAATLLSDARVLVVGGLLEGDNVRTNRHRKAGPEIFDPSVPRWIPASAIPADPNTHAIRRYVEARLAGNPTSTLLRDGTVVVVGGDDAAHSAQLFDPAGEASDSGGSSGGGGSRLAVAAGIAAVAAAGVATGIVWVRRKRAKERSSGGGFR